jgi:hypothetical protein
MSKWSHDVHTFLVSYWDVYEVHKVFEKSPFYYYQYLSGILVKPPDGGNSREEKQT